MTQLANSRLIGISISMKKYHSKCTIIGVAVFSLFCSSKAIARNGHAVEVEYESMSSESLDERVQIILGKSLQSDFRSRLSAVHSLPIPLSDVDAEALVAGIIEPQHRMALGQGEWAALYNDVFNALNTSGVSITDYPKRVLGLISEEERDVVLRDYALQHLLSYVEHHIEDRLEREELLGKISNIAFEAKETTLPSTYLLGIYQMAGMPGYPDSNVVASSAFEIAENSDAFMPNRVTAIQICSQLNYPAALSLSRLIAEDPTKDVGLRMASIASIGQLGTSHFIPFLRKLRHVQGSERRIVYSVDSAIKRLQSK